MFRIQKQQTADKFLQMVIVTIDVRCFDATLTVLAGSTCDFDCNAIAVLFGSICDFSCA